MLVRFNDGIKDVPVTEVTKENYIVPQGEESLFHCVIEIKKFDSETGKRLSVPRVQKFGVKAFKNVQKNLVLQGYSIDILHDPTDFIANQAKAMATRVRVSAAPASKGVELQKMIDEQAKEIAELKKQLAKSKGKK